MKALIFVLFFVLFIPTFSFAQDQSYKSQYLSLSLGRGYIDGIIPLDRIPTIGMGYEKELNRYFSVGLRLFLFYRTMPDSYYTDDANGHPIMDIIVEDAWGPFITQADKDKIKNVGIKDLDAICTIKEFSLPLLLGLNFYPLQYKNHRLGLNLGGGISYNSGNYYKDYYTIMKLTLNDGSVYENIQLSQQTEFRNVEIIETISLMYEFKFNNFKIGARFGECGWFMGSPLGLGWESSIYLSFKL